jgi:hypothetical protein
VGYHAGPRTVRLRWRSAEISYVDFVGTEINGNRSGRGPNIDGAANGGGYWSSICARASASAAGAQLASGATNARFSVFVHRT